MATITGESSSSYEDAVQQIVAQMRDPNMADQLFEFDICKLSYREGGIVGYPITYIAEAEGDLPTS
ncbi:MAG TPA: hypothetical protein VGW40_16300 [Allosphingosinicella sp.]|nr:hypothetical protein [Allosphingosinicella sp.]